MFNKQLPTNTKKYLQNACLWRNHDVYSVFFLGVAWGIFIGVIIHVI